jgi:hypothetical protein
MGERKKWRVIYLGPGTTLSCSPQQLILVGRSLDKRNGSLFFCASALALRLKWLTLGHFSVKVIFIYCSLSQATRAAK